MRCCFPVWLGIVFAGASRTRAARLLSLIVVLSLSTLWLGACGGNSSSSQKNPGTPAGTYPIVCECHHGRSHWRNCAHRHIHSERHRNQLTNRWRRLRIRGAASFHLKFFRGA